MYMSNNLAEICTQYVFNSEIFSFHGGVLDQPFLIQSVIQCHTVKWHLILTNGFCREHELTEHAIVTAIVVSSQDRRCLFTISPNNRHFILQGQFNSIILRVFTCESSYCFQRVLAIAILSVRLSVTRVDQSKTVQARITKSSLSAAWKTLVSGTVKVFHKFERFHPKRGRYMRGGHNLRFLANKSLYLSNGARQGLGYY